MECESAVDEAQEEMLMETTDLECPFAMECETSPMFVVGDKFRSYKELKLSRRLSSLKRIIMCNCGKEKQGLSVEYRRGFKGI